MMDLPGANEICVDAPPRSRAPVCAAPAAPACSRIKFTARNPNRPSMFPEIVNAATRVAIC